MIAPLSLAIGAVAFAALAWSRKRGARMIFAGLAIQQIAALIETVGS